MLLQQEQQSMLQDSLKQNQDPLGSDTSFLNIKQWRKWTQGHKCLFRKEFMLEQVFSMTVFYLNVKIMRN